MTLFFLIAALLIIVVLVLLLPVFTHKSVDTAPERTDININVAKAQSAELTTRLESGEISQDVYNDEKTRLAEALARDIEKDIDVSTGGKNTGQWMLWPMAAIVPIAAGALYINLGTPAAIDPANRVAQQQASAQQQAPALQPPADMQEVVTRIKEQVALQPEDARGWFMLGRAHLTLGEYQQAEAALRRSLEIDNSNVDVAIRLADAIALTQQGSLKGEPVSILKSALEASPDHPQGLWLYGMALNEEGNNQQAVDVWQRLLPLLSDDPASAAEVERLIAGAQQQLGSGATAGTSTQTQTQTQTQAPPASEQIQKGELQVNVNVKTGIATGLSPATAVFVYAKAAAGPPMPLAVVKHTLADLPLTVTLTDAQAMMPTMKLSAFNDVIVGARISKSGDPIAQSGDFFVESDSIEVSTLTAPLSLTIADTVQ